MTPDLEPPIKIAPRVNLTLTAAYHAVMLGIAIFGAIAGAFAAFYSLSARLSEHDVRFAAIEKEISDQHKAESDYEAEMRAAIQNVSTTLTDLRIAIANQLPPRPIK